MVLVHGVTARAHGKPVWAFLGVVLEQSTRVDSDRTVVSQTLTYRERLVGY